MWYELLNEVGNYELPIPNKLTKYMEAISNVDFMKLFKAIKFVIDSKYIK
jgi:predicted RNA-binding protein